jgi:hypothetical protein
LFLAILAFALPVAARKKDRDWHTGIAGPIRTDNWCKPIEPPASAEVRPRTGMTYGSASIGSRICGGHRTDSTIQFASGYAGSEPRPVTQILEVETPKLVYLVKRAGLDGGIHLLSAVPCPLSAG